MKFNLVSLLATVLLSATVRAQLSGTVGPTTTRAAKAAVKVCNVLDYGGVASKTSDIGPPLVSAWAACKSGGEGLTSLSCE
jgi:rhamnogalacturonan hydrolase